MPLCLVPQCSTVPYRTPEGDPAAAEALCGLRSRFAAAEGIEHSITGVAAGVVAHRSHRTALLRLIAFFSHSGGRANAALAHRHAALTTLAVPARGDQQRDGEQQKESNKSLSHHSLPVRIEPLTYGVTVVQVSFRSAAETTTTLAKSARRSRPHSRTWDVQAA
jgi:hypothetical protein